MHDHLPSQPPITISIMLACYALVHPQDGMLGEWNSPAGIQSRRWLQNNGLIDEDQKATDKGRAWVRGICATPLPVSAWVLPERDEGGDMLFPDHDRRIDEFTSASNPLFEALRPQEEQAHG